MKKIPCLFQRDFSDRRNPVLLESVTPGCEWVLDGEGRATVKMDGTPAAIIGGRLYARLDCKRGKTPPEGSIPCSDPDPVTGHWPHWVLADGPEHKYVREGLANSTPPLQDGTYEAVGPKINGNNEGLGKHLLIMHGSQEISPAPRSFSAIGEWLRSHDVEGIVFHHLDGRMAKIRRDDYGLPWPVSRP